MKKWSVITSIVMALLVLAISPMSVLAQTDEDISATSRAAIRDGLAIVAPLVTKVDTEISISVFRCSDQEPVEGAGVWLVTRERVDELRQEMAEVTARDGSDDAQDDYERLLNIHGTLLDRTDDKGKVWHSFDTAGRYVLVTVKRGYLPDSRAIAVGRFPKALGIEAPRRAEVGENVTITVFQRGTEDVVKDAGIWAFTREDAESLKADIIAIRENGDQGTMDAAIETACDVHGTFLGTTNGAGKVKHRFEDAGGYLLVAFKPGYFPGWRTIVILGPAEVSSLERPGSALEEAENN